MDLQTGLVCAAVFVLSAGILILISLFGMRTKSYEEALAEQRGLSAGLLGINYQQKQKIAKDKKQKKILKKVKEKPVNLNKDSTGNKTENSKSPNEELPISSDVKIATEQSVQTRPVHNSKHHVEFKPIDVTVEFDLSPVKNGRKTKRDKQLNVRPILINREPSPVRPVTSEVPILNHFEQSHPKDEKELLKVHNKDDAKSEKTSHKEVKSKSGLQKEVINKSEKTTQNVNTNKTEKVIQKQNISKVEKPSPKENVKSEKVDKLQKDPIIKPEKIPQKQAGQKFEKVANSKPVTIKLEKTSQKEVISKVEKSLMKDISKNEKVSQKETTSKSEKIAPKENISKSEKVLPKESKAEKLTQKDVKNDKAQQREVRLEKSKPEKEAKSEKVSSKENKSEKNCTKDNYEKISKGTQKQIVPEKIIQKEIVIKPEKILSKEDKLKNEKIQTSPKKGKNKQMRNSSPQDDVNSKEANKENQSGNARNSKNKNQPQKQPSIEEHIVDGPVVEKKINIVSEKPSIQVSASVQNNSINTFISQPPRENKKKKKNELTTLQQITANDNSGINVSLLVPLIRKADLSRSEVQILIDLLLNKHHDTPVSHQEWSESRADPVQKLKKQLAEKERALEVEQEVHAGVAGKLREVRGELNARIQALRQAEDANSQIQADRQALVARLQHVQEHIQAEKQLYNQKLQQLQGKINEERQANRQFQEEHSTLQKQRQQLEVHIKRLSDQYSESENSLKNQIAALHNEQQNMSSALGMELHTARNEVEMLRERVAHLQPAADQVQELMRQLDESRRVQSDLEHRLNSSQHNVQAQTDEIRRVEDAKVQAQIEVQKLQSELNKAHTQAKQQQDENEKVVAQIKAELNSAQASANGSAEEEKAKQVELLNLHNELSSVKAALQASQSELETHRIKNNELRQKNWKVMEALNAAEKNLQLARKDADETVNRIKLEEQKRNCELLQRLFPDIKLSVKPNIYEKYVSEFEKAACNYINNLTLSSKSLAEKAVKKAHENAERQIKQKNEEFLRKIKEIEQKQVVTTNEDNESSRRLADANEEIKTLQGLCSKYKTIIETTESMLNKLESKIANEEQNWRGQLNAKEAELAQLKAQFDKTCSVQMNELKEKLHAEIKNSNALRTECEELKNQIALMPLGCDKQNCSSVMAVQELHEEKSHLQTQLTAEQLRCRELAKEVACLGELQEELKVLKSVNQNHNSTSNGPATSIDSSASEAKK